jgi:hypothetical protein
MELWDIKASALRLMFADTDINFDKQDFSSGAVYDNGNTRDKLIRMNDSIRRAIDLYFQYCGQYGRRTKVQYHEDVDGNLTDILNLDNVLDFETPSRIDLHFMYMGKEKVIENIAYYYDHVAKQVMVDINVAGGRLKYTKDTFNFSIYYVMKKENLPKDEDIDELVYDLNDIHIPEDIQRMIPKYIKSEVYEEDEYALAQVAKNEYIQFLMAHARKFSNVQTKVKSIFRRG